MPRSAPDTIGGANIAAFLDMVAWSEGTPQITGSDDGYNVIVGSTPQNPHLFNSYADHPRIYVAALDSTAAGRYQEIERNYDVYKEALSLPNFGPESQDRMAVQQIKERQAYGYIQQGRVALGISLCSNLWASLPGNTYHQHQTSLAQLLAWFKQFGGSAS